MINPCPTCGADRALVGKAHRCVPVPTAPPAPAFASGRTVNLLTAPPRRVDIDRIASRRSKKLFRVRVNGKVIIPETASPFAVFPSLLVQQWTGEVELFRNGKRVGVRDITKEAARIVDAHNRFTSRKRRPK